MDPCKWQVLAQRLSGRGHSLRQSFRLWVQFQHLELADDVNCEYQGPREYASKSARHGAWPANGNLSSAVWISRAVSKDNTNDACSMPYRLRLYLSDTALED